MDAVVLMTAPRNLRAQRCAPILGFVPSVRRGTHCAGRGACPHRPGHAVCAPLRHALFRRDMDGGSVCLVQSPTVQTSRRSDSADTSASAGEHRRKLWRRRCFPVERT